MDYNNQKDKAIVFKEKYIIHQYFIENILYITGKSYLSTIYLSNSVKPKIFTMSLKMIEKKVDSYGFFRLNNNTIVNLRYFDRIISIQNKKKYITKNGNEFTISKRRWKYLKEKLGL